jgi:hypothetical protein
VSALFYKCVLQTGLIFKSPNRPRSVNPVGRSVEFSQYNTIRVYILAVQLHTIEWPLPLSVLIGRAACGDGSQTTF